MVLIGQRGLCDAQSQHEENGDRMFHDWTPLRTWPLLPGKLSAA
jgi:hypothetical protein